MALILEVLLGIYIYLVVGFAVCMLFMFISVKYPDRWFAPKECYYEADALILMAFWPFQILAYLVGIMANVMDRLNDFLRERMGNQ